MIQHRFLSTLSLRRATNESGKDANDSRFLSTLSLRRATLPGRLGCKSFPFLSTLSLRRATLGAWKSCNVRGNFYPRSPCGERRSPRFGFCRSRYFYPRSPCGERPDGLFYFIRRNKISIHALLAESDSKSAQNSGALLRIWNKFYGDCIFMLTGKAVFYPFCPCFFHIFWCEGSGNFMIAFPSH